MLLFLLVGDNGAGKTTLAKLWVKGDRYSRLLEEDNMFVGSKNGILRGFSLSLEAQKPISHIFFVHKNTHKPSSCMPINQKEAFTRIVFHADINFKSEKEAAAQKRLNILHTLVSRSESFVLTNGNDVFPVPQRVRSFIRDALL